MARADILSALLFLMAVISYRQVFSSKTKLHGTEIKFYHRYYTSRNFCEILDLWFYGLSVLLNLFMIEYGGLLLTLLLVLCSALSKEIGITAVALCLLYELLIIRKVYIYSVCTRHKKKIFCKNYYTCCTYLVLGIKDYVKYCAYTFSSMLATFIARLNRASFHRGLLN